MVGREALPTYHRISRRQIILLTAHALKRGVCFLCNHCRWISRRHKKSFPALTLKWGACFLCNHCPNLGRWSERWTFRSPLVYPKTRYTKVALKRGVLWKSYADISQNIWNSISAMTPRNRESHQTMMPWFRASYFYVPSVNLINPIRQDRLMNNNKLFILFFFTLLYRYYLLGYCPYGDFPYRLMYSATLYAVGITVHFLEEKQSFAFS